MGSATDIYSWSALVPEPSFSRAILEVEKALYLGLEATRHDCCSNEVWRKVESARCGHRAERDDKDLGVARAKFLKHIIMTSD